MSEVGPAVTFGIQTLRYREKMHLCMRPYFAYTLLNYMMFFTIYMQNLKGYSHILMWWHITRLCYHFMIGGGATSDDPHQYWEWLFFPTHQCYPVQGTAAGLIHLNGAMFQFPDTVVPVKGLQLSISGAAPSLSGSGELPQVETPPVII